MKKQRPVYLNLFQISFPITAIVSILHRISGVLLFFAIPLVLWALDQSLKDAFGFYTIHTFFGGLVCKIVLWGLLSAFIYHSVAGIRHFLMDCHIGETKEGGRLGAQITLGVSLILIVLLGIGLFLC